MTLQIVRAETRRELAEFVSVPWSIHPGRHPEWIPPLRVMVREMLDPGHDPFWKNADRALFLARREGRAVGRVAAIENRRHNEVHDDRVGFFGFFECQDDAEAARALLDAAADWLRGRGLDRMRGPASPSLNHEAGLLVDGFEHPPVLLTAWNPPYYEALLRGAGLEPLKDMVGYPIDIDAGFRIAPRVRRIVERRAPADDVVFRDIDLKRLDDEIERVRPLFNAAWQGNWGFVPMTPEEFRFTALSLKPLLLKRFCMVAEKDGQPVGFFMVVRDLNRVLRRIPSGRLGPLALVRLLVGVRRIRGVRTMLLGLHPDHRNSAILPRFLHELIDRAYKYDIGFGEASWVLEENEGMTHALEGMGLTPYRRWRLFERAVG